MGRKQRLAISADISVVSCHDISEYNILECRNYPCGEGMTTLRETQYRLSWSGRFRPYEVKPCAALSEKWVSWALKSVELLRAPASTACREPCARTLS